MSTWPNVLLKFGGRRYFSSIGYLNREDVSWMAYVPMLWERLLENEAELSDIIGMTDSQ